MWAPGQFLAAPLFRAASAIGLGVVGKNLRSGIGTGEDNGILDHGFHYICGNRVWGGYTDEHAGSNQGGGQSAGFLYLSW